MAAGSTYSTIATTTLSSSQTTVTFNSFSGYTDLVLIVAATMTSGGATFLTFNSDTGTNYSQTRILGDGTSATTARRTNNTNIVVDAPNSSGGNTIFNIMNYSNSTTFKTVLARGNTADAYVSAVVGLWRSTASITYLSLTPDAGQFASGSQFTLYGISAA